MLKLLEHEDLTSQIGECVRASGKSGQMDFMRRGAEELRGNDRTRMISRSEGWNSFTESVAATGQS